jgi:hypothetical protein
MTPATDSRDKEEIRKVVRQIYGAISGPAGPRNWAFMARSFAPEGRLIVVHKQADGSIKLQPLTVADYERTRSPYFNENAFYENETRSDIVIEENLAHAISYYESRHAPAEPPFDTGVNFIQLVRTSDGWRVLSTMWEAGAVATRLTAS